MSKKSKKSIMKNQDTEFLTLVRRDECYVDNHCGSEESAEHWKRKYYQLKQQSEHKIAKLEKLVRELEEDKRLFGEMLDMYQSDDYSSSTPAYDEPLQEEPRIKNSAFERGLGVAIRPGQDPKVYRLSDPDGDLIPDRKFAGAELEIQPGRGFQIGLHWRDKK